MPLLSYQYLTFCVITIQLQKYSQWLYVTLWLTILSLLRAGTQPGFPPGRGSAASEASRFIMELLRVSCGGGLGAQPQRGPGAEPRWGVRRAKPPGKFLRKLGHFGNVKRYLRSEIRAVPSRKLDSKTVKKTKY